MKEKKKRSEFQHKRKLIMYYLKRLSDCLNIFIDELDEGLEQLYISRCFVS